MTEYPNLYFWLFFLTLNALLFLPYYLLNLLGVLLDAGAAMGCTV